MVEMMTYLLIIGSIIGVFVVWFIGRLFDIHFRCSMMRLIDKVADYGILCISSKDRKRIEKVIVSFKKDCLWVDCYCWIFDKRHLFRELKHEKGFYIQDHHVIFEEGVPCLYVDRNDLKPLSFEGEENPVKPNEVASGLKAWIDNERAKMMAQNQSMQTLLIVCVIFSLIAAGLGYMSMTKANDNEAKLLQIEKYFSINENTTTTFNANMGITAAAIPTAPNR